MQGVKAALFFDLHTHMLYGVDDGAPDRAEMIAMLETAYADGVSSIAIISARSQCWRRRMRTAFVPFV